MNSYAYYGFLDCRLLKRIKSTDEWTVDGACSSEPWKINVDFLYSWNSQ